MTSIDRSYLHPEARRVIEGFEAGGKKYYYTYDSVEEARSVYEQRSKFASGNYDFDGTSEEMFVPSSDVPTGLPITVNKPSNCDGDPVILIFFHGGGFTLGSRASRQVMCQMIATQGKCIVVNAEYRIGPEHRTPAWLNDGVTVAKWVKDNKLKIGGGLNSKIGVSGDSAGGTIASCLVFEVPDIDFQILIYPRIGYEMTSGSFKAYSENHLLTMKQMLWFKDMYVNEDDSKDPRFNLMLREDLSKVPATLFIVAECDPLREDSYAFAEKLDKAGVKNEVFLLKGVMHSFVHSVVLYPENCEKTYNKIIEFMSQYKN
ncbi:unnamed protein product [Owenia fusiformis]|uniref:Uncharacterized protein n=1 Tax=Owenia fusiformis TaxID=6347 RepID=A0A8J1UEI5_OWEFU|nr:unnamed protein product [Owenia fusiformis]